MLSRVYYPHVISHLHGEGKDNEHHWLFWVWGRSSYKRSTEVKRRSNVSLVCLLPSEQQTIQPMEEDFKPGRFRGAGSLGSPPVSGSYSCSSPPASFPVLGLRWKIIFTYITPPIPQACHIASLDEFYPASTYDTCGPFRLTSSCLDSHFSTNKQTKSLSPIEAKLWGKIYSHCLFDSSVRNEIVITTC